MTVLKNIMQNPITAAILGSVVAVILGFILIVPITSSKITDIRSDVTQLTDRVDDLSGQVGAMSAYFKSKYPGVNFIELANTIAKKNLPTNAFYKTLSLIDIENDPGRSRTFLTNDLGFTPDEAKLIIPAAAKLPDTSKAK